MMTVEGPCPARCKKKPTHSSCDATWMGQRIVSVGECLGVCLVAGKTDLLAEQFGGKHHPQSEESYKHARCYNDFHGCLRKLLTYSILGSGVTFIFLVC